MTDRPDPAPPPDADERRPWAEPTLTVIDLADGTQGGNVMFTDETTVPSASQMNPPS